MKSFSRKECRSRHTVYFCIAWSGHTFKNSNNGGIVLNHDAGLGDLNSSKNKLNSWEFDACWKENKYLSARVLLCLIKQRKILSMTKFSMG